MNSKQLDYRAKFGSIKLFSSSGISSKVKYSNSNSPQKNFDSIGSDSDSTTLDERIKSKNVTYLEDIDEFSVANVAVLVCVEVIEYDTEFLSGEEDSELR